MEQPVLDGSRADLMELIKRRGGLTVERAVDELEIEETTVRQHLDRLSERALVGFRRESDGPGRPRHVYYLTDLGERLYPSSGGALLRELVAYLGETGNEELVSEFFREFWQGRWEVYREEFAGEDETLDERIDSLVAFLDSEGFMSEVDRHDDGEVEIRECNCPLKDVVDETQVPCRLEAEFLKRALERPLSRVEYMPDGEAACTYIFSGAEETDDRVDTSDRAAIAESERPPSPPSHEQEDS